MHEEVNIEIKIHPSGKNLIIETFLKSKKIKFSINFIVEIENVSLIEL